MRRPRHQNLILGLLWMFAGALVAGAALDTLSNAVNLVSPTVTYLGSILLLSLWFLADQAVRRYSLGWAASGGHLVRLRRLGKKSLFLTLGATLVLWLPRVPEMFDPARARASISDWWLRVKYPESHSGKPVYDNEMEYEMQRVADYKAKRDELRESVYREGLSLNLPLANGEIKEITDEPCECEGDTRYDYISFLAEIDSYLMRVHYWEGEGYLLVNRKGGKETLIPGFPVVSPGGHRVVSVYDCEETEEIGCWGGDSMMILYNKGDALVEECYARPDLLPGKPAWVDEDTILFRDSTETKNFKTVRAQRLNGVWSPFCSGKDSSIQASLQARDEAK